MLMLKRLLLSFLQVSFLVDVTISLSCPQCTCYFSIGITANLAVSLVNGTVAREGRIQSVGEYAGTICAEGWTEEDANIICRKLGYEGAEKHLVYDFGEGTGDVWTNYSSCLLGYGFPCDPGNVTSDTSCGHDNDVGVVCLPLRIRLIGEELHEGKVEFFHRGEWSMMSAIDINEADVICRTLGYPSANYTECCTSGTTSEDETLTYAVECTGDETDLSDCLFKWLLDADSYKSGVKCSTDGVSLTDGEFASDGRLEVYTDSEWHTVCARDLNMDAGRVICKQLGFEDILSIAGYRLTHGYNRLSGFPQAYINNTWTYLCETEASLDMFCFQKQTSGVYLSRKGEERTSYGQGCTYCTQGSGPFGCAPPEEDPNNQTQATAYEQYDYVECSQEVTRIQGGGNQGMIEVFRDGRWLPACNDHWNLATTKITCKELHFLDVNQVQSIHILSNPSPDAVVIQCNGSESSLLQCPIDDTVSCASTTAHVTCSDVGIRLQGSPIQNAGRVEVYSDGEWSTICNRDWDINDAHVACRMLGYPEATTVYTYVAYGKGVGSILPRSFLCNGDETNLFDCPSTSHSTSTTPCGHADDVGLLCYTEFIRLSDGSESAGRVELYIDGQWGTVCDDNWDIDDAFVVCRQLGFDGASGSYSSNRYGSGEGPIHLDEVQCTGNETDLLQCDSQRENDCEHSEDAAVSCFSESRVNPIWLGPLNSVQTEEVNHTCSINQFTCTSGACILKSLVCDGNFDCPDNSDEIGENCIQECFKVSDGSDYRGTQDTTENGRYCLSWTSTIKGRDAIYPVDYTNKGIGDHNFCRNPNGRCRPWCYSGNFYEMNDCAVPSCGKYIGNETRNDTEGMTSCKTCVLLTNQNQLLGMFSLIPIVKTVAYD
ncbi:scavenger receptor cysteine-rich domain superfamily protein-like [Antedon mediterranea]|uniref:scavenger receptor cysteine-rich domain superfamily protein-like n=1 Tax=Antedon mediterranea TaxID=105859 RepID=UPI003AF6F7A6